MKINFKKALATAAAFSLGMVGLAAPAQAAPTKVTLAPVAGTSLNGIIGAGFGLKATVAGADGASDLVFVVTGYDTDSDVTLASAQVASVADYAGTDVAGDVGALAPGAENANDDLVSTVAAIAAATPYALLGLGLDDAEVTTATSLTVYAFIDTNGDEVFDADLGEIKSNSVTVKYTPADEVTLVASQTHDLQANTTDVAVSFSGINNANIWEDTLATLATSVSYLDGVEVGAAAGAFVAADWSADDEAFVQAGLATGATNASVVTTKVYAGEETTGAKTLHDDLADTDVASYGDISVAQTQFYALANGANFDIRSGDGQVTFTMDVLDADGVGVAGQTVTWVLTDVALADGVVKAGGKTLNAAGTTIKPTSVTDADGTASLTVTYTDMDETAADEFTIEGSVLSSNVAGNAAKTVLAADGDEYTVYVANAQEAGSIVVASEKTATVELQLRDQYGLVPAGTWRVNVNVTDNTNNPLDGIDINKWVNFSAGKGTLAIEGTEAGDVVLSLVEANALAGDALQVKVAGVWTDTVAVDLAGNLGAVEGVDTITFVDDLGSVSKVKVDTAASHDADADEEVLLDETVGAATPLVSLDVRALGGNDLADTYQTVAAAADAAGVNNIIDVDVLDADNLAVAGASVTFSAPGVMFYDADATVFGDGSLTVKADTNGNVVVHFASNTSGTHTVTVTSGSGSDTIDVVIAQAVIASTADIVLISAETYEASKTYKFQARIVDANGNGVALAGDGGAAGDLLTVDYDGPGLLVGNLPTVSSATGLVSFSILMGANDSGTGTIGFVYDFGGAADLEVSFEITLAVAETPVVADTKVNAGSFKGYVAVYAKGYEGKRLSAKVGKDWVVVPALASNFVRVVEYTGAGYTIAVRIYIDRVLVDTITVVTK